MNNESFIIKTIILKSNHLLYEEKKKKRLKIKEYIGGGSYGIVYLLDNNHVIKIFKKSNITNTNLDETQNLIPMENENRELIFYFKYKNKKEDHKYIIQLYCIGILNDEFIKERTGLDEDAYFIILPYCQTFYKKFKIWDRPLIDTKNGILFTLKVMKRLLELSNYLEIKYNYINLDFTLNNFMFPENSDDINELIMIDFSIIKSKVINKKIDFKREYYIWPIGNNIILENIPSYSICINGLELLFGNSKISKLPNKILLNNILLIIQKKNRNLYNIFYNGLYLNINTITLLKYINNFSI
jgi:hypothetical protein